MIVALLYFVTAGLLLWLASRFVRPISAAATLGLLLLPLCFTGRALLIGRLYAPVEMSYMTFPLWGHRAEMGVGEPHNLLLSDIAFQMLPWRESVRRSLGAGEWPLLNPFMMCGDILAAAAQPAAFSPFTWVATLVPAAVSFTFSGAIAFFIAALGTFLFLRELGCREVPAMFGAATFAFSAPIALQILWPLGFCWTLLPFVLMATRRVVATPSFSSTVLLTVALTLLALSGHPETLFHVVVIGAAYGLFELSSGAVRGAGFSRRVLFARALGAALVSGVLALLLSAIALLPFLEASPQTVEYRLRTEITSKLPLPVGEGHVGAALLSDLFPFVRPRFEVVTQRSEAGSIALALAIFGLIAVKSREKWFFLPLLVICLLAGARAWPVAQGLHALPLFNISLNERLASAVPLCLAVLAALAVDAFAKRSNAPAEAGAPFVMLIVLGVLGAAAYAMRDGPLDRATLIAELVPLGIAAVVMLIAARRPASVPVLPILVGLLLIQRTMADATHIPVHRREVAYAPVPLFERLTEIRDPFRIVATNGTLIPNTATMFGLEDVRGNTAMNFQWLEETNALWCRHDRAGFHEVDDLTRPMLSMMNVRFALTRASDAIPRAWREVMVDRGTRLLENEQALPRAYVPGSIRIGMPPGAAIEEMKLAASFAERAWIEGQGVPQELPNGPGLAVTRRARQGYEIAADMKREGWCVISQASWKGWRALVDGGPAELRRANHAFLAVHIPAGKHVVRLVYLPRGFVVGRAITLTTLAVLIAAGVMFRRRAGEKARLSSRA